MRHEEMLALQIGDIVCDCRFEHLKIVAIEEDHFPKGSLQRYFGWLPFFVYDFLWDRWPSEVVDKELTLEGGMHCSAIHCADLVPHEWSHAELSEEVCGAHLEATREI